MRNRQIVAEKVKSIPPPPEPEEGYDAIIAYFKKYSMQELAATATYQLLCRNGLHLRLPRKDYELLSRLAARKDTAVETLAKGWILQSLRQEAKQLAAG